MNKSRLYNLILTAIAVYTVIGGGSMAATLFAVGILAESAFSRYMVAKEAKNLEETMEKRIAAIEQLFKDKTSSLETRLAAMGMLGNSKRL